MHSQPAPSRLRVSVAVAAWVGTNLALVFYNKFLLFDLGFNFPMTVTLVQMAVISLGLALYYRARRRQQPSPYAAVGAALFLRYMAPFGAMFAFSTVVRNYAYLYMSLAAMQVVASTTPAIVYALALAAGQEVLTAQLAAAVALCCAGVAAASTGTLSLSPLGVALQFGAIAVHALRGILYKHFTQLPDAPRVDAVGALYLTAPVAAALLALPALLHEGAGVAAYAARLSGGAPVAGGLLLGNAAAAGALNVATFHLVRTASVLTGTFAGVAKDCALVVGTVLAGQQHYTPLNAGGWAVSVAAVCWYTLLKYAPKQ